MRRQLGRRAEALQRIRGFFAERGVLEVGTDLIYPVLPTDPCSEGLRVVTEQGAHCGWLQPSPEFPMKRLLAAGSGDIYQICQAFRAAERGPLHRPEFTLVEWYRLGMDYRALARETVALVRRFLPFLAVRETTYAALWARHLGMDPVAFAPDALRARLAAARRTTLPGDLDAAQLRDLAFAELIAPHLGDGIVTIFDFPAAQTAMARRHDLCPDYARRFEVLAGGVELANGYEEVTDAVEQRRRFTSDNETRRRRGLPQRALDESLLAAMATAPGLPPCAGVALGLERLMMLADGRDSLAPVGVPP